MIPREGMIQLLVYAVMCPLLYGFSALGKQGQGRARLHALRILQTTSSVCNEQWKIWM